MKKYSFMGSYSNCSREEILSFMEETDKPFKYTYGLGYRNPTIHNVDITKDKAIETFKKGSLVDVKEYEDYVHVNEYSSNDMW